MKGYTMSEQELDNVIFFQIDMEPADYSNIRSLLEGKKPLGRPPFLQIEHIQVCSVLSLNMEKLLESLGEHHTSNIPGHEVPLVIHYGPIFLSQSPEKINGRAQRGALENRLNILDCCPPNSKRPTKTFPGCFTLQFLHGWKRQERSVAKKEGQDIEYFTFEPIRKAATIPADGDGVISPMVLLYQIYNHVALFNLRKVTITHIAFIKKIFFLFFWVVSP
jgi:hypothetical protein